MVIVLNKLQFKNFAPRETTKKTDKHNAQRYAKKSK